MKPDLLASHPSIRERIRVLMEKPPENAAEREACLEQIITAACEPLEANQGELEELRQRVSTNEAAAEQLRAENERLRARLAGQRQNESAVHERAEVFRTLAENSPDLILRLDRNLCHVYANPVVAALAGVSASDLVGMPVTEVAFYQPVLETFVQRPDPFETGEEVRAITSYPAEAGPRWYDVRIVPESDSRGRVLTLLVVARDITDLKTAEEALRRSEQRFRLASDGAGLVIFEQDLALQYTWGYDWQMLSDQPILGKGDEEIFSAEDAAALTALKRQVLASGDGLRRELQLMTHRGPLSFDVILEPLLEADGQVCGLLGAYADITQRKETERELSYRSLLLENVHDAIIATDANLRITTWNTAATELYGWQAAEVLGQHIFKLIQTEFPEGDHYLSPEKMSSGQVFKVELVQYTRAGRRVYVESYGMALFNDDGQVSGFVSANRDITARRMLEKENETHRQSLVAQRELLQAIIQGNPSGIAVISGPEYRFQIVNAAYRAVLPRPEIDPIGRTIQEIWPQEEGFLNVNLIRQVIEEEASVSVERVTRHYPDGSVRYLTLHARPIDWIEKPAALLVIWETTQLEKALQEAEEGRRMLEALMEFIPESITIISAPEERILLSSKYSAGLARLQRGELEGMPFKEMMGAWSLFRADGVTPLPWEEQPSIRAARGGEVVEDEEIILKGGDHAANVLLNAGPIRDGEGRIFAAVTTARDITERKREEANHRFLSELSQAMVAMTTPDQVLHGVPEQLGRYLNAARCFICETDPGTGQHVIHADYHPALPSITGMMPECRIAPGVLKRVQQGKPVIIADLSVDPLTMDYYQDLYEPLSIRALVLMPWLDWQGNLTGMLALASDGPRTWQPDEIGMLRSVAHLARLSLENTYLFGDLKDFRQRFELALRNAPISVFTADSDLHVNWIFNPPRQFTAEQAVGRLPEEADPNQVGAPLYALARSVLASGQGERRELRFETRDGPVYHDVTIEPLLDERGKVVGVAAAAMETTPLRRMEADAVKNLAQIEVQHRLIAERELERTRIAREIHDGPLQDLIAVSFNLVEAMDIAEKEQRLGKMRLIQSMLQAQIRALRRFCNDLRPPVLAPFGLEKTIRSHAENLRELYPDLQIQLNLQRDGKRLSEERRMALYRVYQELMNNVLRHSGASSVTVSLRILKARVQLEVKDNGVGFNNSENWLEMARKGHLGLVGVRERVEIVGGQVELFSGPDQGTRVRVIVPL